MPNYLKIPDVAWVEMLHDLIHQNFGNIAFTIDVDLFTAYIVPSSADDWTTYSGSIASFTGYATVSKGEFNWITPVVTSNIVESETDDCTFTCTVAPGSPVIAYGYTVRQQITGTSYLKWAQLFDSPLVFTNAGDSYSFKLRMQLQNAH